MTGRRAKEAWRGAIRMPALEQPKPIRTSLGAWIRRLARRRYQALPLMAGREFCLRRGLRREPEPDVLRPIGLDRFGRRHWLTPAAGQALKHLLRAAAGCGIPLEVISSYRSVCAQRAIIARKLNAGQSLADIYSVNAPPGYSEHHSGQCVDFAIPGEVPLTETFESTSAFVWLTRHAHLFGWRMSYPRGNAQGYIYEPWHWRFAAPVLAPLHLRGLQQPAPLRRSGSLKKSRGARSAGCGKHGIGRSQHRSAV